MPRQRRRSPLLALAALLLVTGCGAQVREESAPAADGYPVTVSNCGEDLTFDRPPERIVAYDSGIVETLFALGLGDRIQGYVLPREHDRDVENSPWRADFESVRRLGVDTISKEVILEEGADFVYAGWNYGFREDTGLTPRHLADLGVPSYVLSESCRNGNTDRSRGVMSPIDALYTDLRNLGRIFGVSERAEELIAEYREVVRQAEATVPDDRPRPSVFLYDSGTDQPFTGGRYAASHEVITRGGGEDIMGDLEDSWTTTTWETVVKRDPDVIVINDYDPPSAAEKQAFLESFPPLRHVSAIKHKRFLVLSYAELVQGPRNAAAVRVVADYLNGLPSMAGG
ncbi:ABC transporter substrate-binding protein [Prauserella cavernicola]|uniref:ABC transporter substrate-binding protein n=1 Tax=Prauserella cavernicola TaxID=2800127 RepID=A0A934QUF9_9PSEU|nr:ABC transporter substrate-binding protein [Prauserella cavernicola]MBK1786660.1 ABC transporter substrate-binding protein [Prauserella cavernicola]